MFSQNFVELYRAPLNWRYKCEFIICIMDIVRQCCRYTEFIMWVCNWLYLLYFHCELHDACQVLITVCNLTKANYCKGFDYDWKLFLWVVWWLIAVLWCVHDIIQSFPLQCKFIVWELNVAPTSNQLGWY